MHKALPFCREIFLLAPIHFVSFLQDPVVFIAARGVWPLGVNFKGIFTVFMVILVSTWELLPRISEETSYKQVPLSPKWHYYLNSVESSNIGVRDGLRVKTKHKKQGILTQQCRRHHGFVAKSRSNHASSRWGISQRPAMAMMTPGDTKQYAIYIPFIAPWKFPYYIYMGAVRKSR